ncbi:WD40 repeat domain-containing protein, partial [Sphaerisporangium fuscum]|uniref:WD40 repeat domain-containing protein n=1 Tax=Sphaerisporangium fuscum TaxID=2835868 RepID=UPI001BDCE66B
IMLFAATGEDPFKAESLGGVMHRVLSVDPDLSPLPASLRPLVDAALQKNPLARPSSRDLLLALIAGGGAADTPGLLAEGSRAAGDIAWSETHDPSLGVLAEDAYGLLSQAERELVPAIFLRLAAIGPDGEITTRRVPEEELPPEADRVLRVFGYVLSRRDGEIVLTRPGLMRAWPRLRSWLADERDGLAVHAAVGEQARQWAGHGRRDGDLLQGSRLDTAMDWAAGRRHLRPGPLEKEFLDASSALSRRRARRRRLLVVTLSVLLVMSLVGGGLAVYQGGQLTRQRDSLTWQRDQAKGREAAFVAGMLRTTDPAAAMLLSVAAWRLDAGAEARSSMTTSLYQPETDAFREPPVKELADRTLSRDGRLLASVSTSEVRLYDVPRKRLVKRMPTGLDRDEPIDDLSFSPSGRLLAVKTPGKVVVWNLASGTARRLVLKSRVGSWLPGWSGSPFGLQAMRLASGVRFGQDDSKLGVDMPEDESFVWDVTTGRTYGRGTRGGMQGAGPVVLRGGRLAVLVTEKNRVDVRRLPGWVRDPRAGAACPRTVEVALSPADDTLACGGSEIRLVDLRTGRRILPERGATWRWTDAAAAGNTGLRFSPDGRYLLGLAGRVLTVWRVADQQEIFSYKAEGEMSDARFDPDGHTLRYLLDDSVVTLDFRPLPPATRAPGQSLITGLSPDGRWLSVAGESAPIRVWDVRRHRFAATLTGTSDASVPPAFDLTGRTVATVSGLDARVTVWDAGTWTRLWRFVLPVEVSVGGIAFSPDGTTLAASLVTNSDKPTAELRLWDARTGRVTGKAPLEGLTGWFGFSPDGRLLATSTGQFVDPASGRQAGTGFGSFSGSNVFAFSPKGDLLAASGGEGRISLWDARTLSPLPPVLHGSAGDIAAMAFSPGGDVFATGAGTGTVQLWDTAARRRLGGAVQLPGEGVTGVAFSPDGGTLYVSEQSGSMYELPVSAERVARAVCDRAGRTLTGDEWRRYLPGIPYRDVCAS